MDTVTESTASYYDMVMDVVFNYFDPASYDPADNAMAIMYHQMYRSMLLETNCTRCVEALDKAMEPIYNREIIGLYQLQFLSDTFDLFVFGFISMFGVISNVINIIVFYRQGILQDSCTVSFLGITVSDFMCCLIGSFYCLMNWLWQIGNFKVYNFSSRERESIDAIRNVINQPKQMFIQITCGVSVFLAFERLFSVFYPFKVKTVFTPKRSLVIICGIYLATFILYIPQNFTRLLERVRHSDGSYTVGTISVGVLAEVSFDYAIANDYIIRIILIVIIVVMNFIMAWKVNTSKQFRKTASTMALGVSTKKSTVSVISKASQDGEKVKPKMSKMSNKEKKLMRMVWVILVVLVVSYTPGFVTATIFMADWVRHFTVFEMILIGIFRDLCGTINSSCNIVIYIILSTRYRQVLTDMCCCCRRKNKMIKHR